MMSDTLNSITPGNEYLVTQEVFDFINKIVGGQLSSICFYRKTEEGVLLKPATNRDKKFLLDAFKQIGTSYQEKHVTP